MAGLTMTTADAVLKEDYLPGIREQLNQDTFLSQIEKDEENIQGRRAVLALSLSRNSGVGARAEGGTLPNAGNHGYYDEYIATFNNYGRIQLTRKVIKAMASDSGSFTRALKSEMAGIRSDVRRDVGRQIFGDSTGVIAQCTTTTGSATVNLATATSQVQMGQFYVGQLIDIASASGGVYTAITNGTATNITAIDTTNLTLTVGGGVVTTSSSHFVGNTGSLGSGTSQKEITGFQTSIKSSGTLWNVNPTTYPAWAAYNDGVSSDRAVSENLITKTQQKTRINGGEDFNLIVTSDGVHRAYGNLLTSQKRFPDTTDLKGGYKGLDVAAGGGSVPMTWDRDCPAKTLYGINTDHFKEYQMGDWEWADDDGHVLRAAGVGTSGVDSFEGYLVKYHEVATDKRNAHAYLTNLTEA